ncbi:proteophosphoglycan ppg4 [Angomonas deanei]|uniref:Uncharacterized protein n=1 Tax=Angomonas deanei TaxID=59799 RepID=A0A7G2CKW9_9TRYP|nr:proteophosphoglycan ppg4 [Angomonas deanei]CAD2219581.1 hypothetical protein, conserved [Angomonas deanei]|eukprot:EPY18714.1 proteophosphoglycan ppg4 [Angomonas deanei]
MASVTKQRIGVRQALSKFVSSVQVLISEKNDDGEENTSHRRLSGGQSSGSNSPNATPRGKSRRNSTGSKLGEVGTPAMHRKARVVTNGLREVQTEVGKLLLSLGEYAKESRKPLGTLRSFRASDGAFQPSRGASFDGNSVSVNSAHNVSASGSAPPPLPSIPPLFSNSEPPTPSASPQGFVEFLRQQEGEIAAQLDDLRDTVRRVLAISDVTVDDDRVFSSPLFLCPAKGATAEVGEGAKSPSTPRASGPAKSQVSPRKKDKATPMTPRTKAKKEKEGKASVSSLPPMSARSGAQNALAVVVTVATPTDKDHGKNGVVLKLTSATPRGNRTPRRRGSEPLTPRSVTEKAVKPPTRSASAGAGTGKKKLKRAASASKKKDTSAAATGAPSSSNAPSRGINKSTLKKEKEPKPAADETQIVSPHLLPMTDLLEAKTVWDSIKNKLPVHNTTGTIPSPPKLWKGSDSAPSPKESAARNKSSSDTREMNSGDAVVTQVSATEDEVKVSSPDGKKEEITEDTKQNNAQRVIDLDATAVTDLNVSDILATGAGGESPLPRFPESQVADPPEGAQTPTTGDLEMEMKEDSKETYGDVGKKIQENSTTLPPSMSVSKPRLTGTKEEQAVTLIAACWRRYKAQKEMTFLFRTGRTSGRWRRRTSITRCWKVG